MTEGKFTHPVINFEGRRVAYECFGKGRDIIFLHGWGGDASAFLFAAKALADRFRVTLIEFPGFGESEQPPRAYTVADYARCVLRVASALGIERATLVGHSFGGRVSLEIAAKFPHFVDKLALVDSAGLKPRRGLKYYFLIYLHKILVRLGRKGLEGSKDFRALSPVMKSTFKNVVNYDQTPLLKRISCPTAVFWGRDDKDTPPYMAKKFVRNIADSHIFWLNGGHFAYIDDMGAFMAVLTAFVSAREEG